jgi:hypothetical protein
MSPTYHEGDLVVVGPAGSYRPGQIVAYRDRVHHLVVLHRIVGEGSGGLALKGDGNATVDAVHPARNDVLGRALLHIPRGGTWLHRLLGPLPVALAAVALLGAGGTTGARRRRRTPMPRYAARAPSRAGPPHRRLAAGAAVLVAAPGLALGALTWTAPVPPPAPVVPALASSMTFSYDATVRRSAAYDGTTVRSPSPVFRRLANAVTVHLAYEGAPGTLSVDAELSTAAGWRSTVPLAPRRTVTTGRARGAVRLDLAALAARATAAAAVTGVPADGLTVVVTARVVHADGTTFEPAVRLALTPLQLALSGGPETLTVRAVPPRVAQPPAARAVLGRRFSGVGGDPRATAVAVVALLAAGMLGAVSRRGRT